MEKGKEEEEERKRSGSKANNKDTLPWTPNPVDY